MCSQVENWLLIVCWITMILGYFWVLIGCWTRRIYVWRFYIVRSLWNRFLFIIHKCHLGGRTCGHTLGLGRFCDCPPCWWSEVRRGLVGTMTTGNVGAGGGWLLFLPVNIFTVLCIKSVFGPLGPASGRFDVDDIEWHRTTRGALPPDHSLLLLELLLPIDPSSPAELDLYGGGDSDSSTVRFGGGLMHFWYISDSWKITVH